MLNRIRFATQRVTELHEEAAANRLENVLAGQSPLKVALIGLLCVALTMPIWVALFVAGR